MTDLQNRMITALGEAYNLLSDERVLMKNTRIEQLKKEIRSILDTNLSSPELKVHQDGSIDKLNKTLQQTNTQLDYLNKTLQRIR